jgi:CubicO group peptidase (beta-lactamase class C family)
MTQREGTITAARFDGIWQVLDQRVADGRIPGYVAAVRLGDEVQAHVGGRMGIEPDAAPMAEDTLFRIASITKPIGAALTLNLVQEGVLTLDDPIARWLPEAANPRVLIDPNGPLDQTREAQRLLTVRHLLTFTGGWGAVMQANPLQAAMLERGVFPGPLTPEMSGDEFVTRVCGLPLAFEPGEGWLYDTCLDVLGVLLARATGKPVSELFAERITGPLGMPSTSFWTPDVDRLATAYEPGDDGLEILDPPDGVFSRPPRFEELSSGLLSTAGDLLTFYAAMADGGGPVLTPASVALMTTDALTGAQREAGSPIVGGGLSWGLGTGVDIEAAQPWMAPGRWGWTGGTGTTAFVDPVRDTVSVLLTQRMMTGPQDGPEDFWAAVAQAV